jgi:O-antigen/teichoic acid export membrane protein
MADLANQTIKNSIYNFVVLVFPVAVSLIVTPIIVHSLGVSDFGIYLVANVLVGLLSLLDFGLIPTLIKSIAQYFELKEYAKLYQVINSALALYTFLGLAVMVVLYSLRLPINSLLKLNLSNQDLTIIVLLAGGIFFANGFRAVLGSILNGLQRYDLGSKVMLLNVFFVNLAMLFAIFSGGKYLSLIFIQFLSVIFLIVGYFYYSKKILPGWQFRIKFTKEVVLPELRFSGYVFVNQVASTALFQLDKLILSIMLGPALVPYYALPGTVAQKTQDVSTSLTGALFPLATQLHIANEQQRLQAIYRRTINVIAFMTAALMFVMILYSKQILQYWLHGDFAAKSASILIILAVTYFFVALLVPLNNFLLGKGRAKELAIFNTLMCIIDVGLVLVLVPRIGIIGAAWAYLASVLAVPMFFYYSERKFFNLNDTVKFYSKMMAKLAVTFAISFAICFFSYFFIVNLASLLFFIALSLLVFVLVHYMFGFFENEDVQLFKSVLRKAKILPQT